MRRKAGRKETPGTRGPSPRKKGGVGCLTVLSVIFMVFGFGLYTHLAIVRLNLALSEPASTAVEEPAQQPAGRSAPFEGEEILRSRPAWDSRLSPILALLASLLVSALLFMNLGQGAQDLGHVGREMEWLFTFPASRSALLLARLVAHGPCNPSYWAVLLPFLVIVHASSAPTGWAILTAPFHVLFLTILLGAIHLAVETWSRKKLPAARLKNLQALFLILGTVGLMGLTALALAQRSDPFLIRYGGVLGTRLLWTPPGISVLTCLDAGSALKALAGIGAWALAGATAALLVSGRLIRDGLIGQSSTLQGRRGRAWVGAGSPLMPPGLVGKDLRLLLRDRNLLAQVFILPLILLAFHFYLISGPVASKLASPANAATLAFVAGAYALLLGSPRSLRMEGRSFWLLYTLPCSLARTVFLKAVLMGFVVSPLSLAILLVGWVRLEAPPPNFLLDGALAMGGVWAFAFIATGIFVQNIDYLEADPRKSTKVGPLLFLMLLMSMYIFAFHAPGLWPKLAMAFIFYMLALAVTQDVRDRAPFLLDPDRSPPPAVTVADGMAALCAFFILHGLFFAGIHSSGMEPGPSLSLGFFLAGAATFWGSLVLFRLRLPWHDLAARLGLKRARGCPPVSAARSLGEGLLWGGLALLLGLAYLGLLRVLPDLDGLREGLLDLQSATQKTQVWLLLLGVLGAPLFEEYLFRGIIYRALRRTWKPGPAMLASAALFAAVHPPVAMLPVFFLGLLAAFAFERTGLLLAPILAHALYNAGVMGVQFIW